MSDPSAPGEREAYSKGEFEPDEGCVDEEALVSSIASALTAAHARGRAEGAEAMRESAAEWLDAEAASLGGEADECVVIKRWPETCSGVTDLRHQAHALLKASAAIRALPIKQDYIGKKI